MALLTQQQIPIYKNLKCVIPKYESLHLFSFEIHHRKAPLKVKHLNILHTKAQNFKQTADHK